MLVCLSAWNIYRLDAKLPVLVNLQHSFIESTVCLLFFFFCACHFDTIHNFSTLIFRKYRGKKKKEI